jgi:DNA repair protein RecN (Recombination protein N)
MLETLNIRNFVLIDQSEIQFKPGLNIISGETGAGKSIIIDAISLLLGDRAQTDLIRIGTDEASIEGLFDISNLGEIQARLISLGIERENETGAQDLLIRRTVNRTGKHRVFINSTLTNLHTLQLITEGLVDLCSQHEHQTLLKPSSQLRLLDRFAGLDSEAEAFRSFFLEIESLKKQFTELESTALARTRQIDFLKFQVNELREADLSVREDDELHAEKQLLQTAESRMHFSQNALNLLENEETSINQQLRILTQKLKQLAQVDEGANTIFESSEKLSLDIAELSDQIQRYSERIDVDPNRLAAVQDRLSVIANLRKKYGITIEEMLVTLSRLENELLLVESGDHRIESLQREIELKTPELHIKAVGLSEARKKFAGDFQKRITTELKSLKMENAELTVEFTPRPVESPMGADGLEAIQFLIRTNAGDDAKPLAKIASGGELSRVMLSVRQVISDRGGIGVYLFDEIDSGMSGQTAFEVGKKLKAVAKQNQVICITHLPQVAAFADHHLTVKKQVAGKKTSTEISDLNKQGRKEELARMLGGSSLTRKSLDNAAELLQMARP